MNNAERKHHTPEEKVSILRRHFIEKVPVSNFCQEFGLHPTVFYCSSVRLVRRAGDEPAFPIAGTGVLALRRPPFRTATVIAHPLLASCPTSNAAR